MNIQYLKPEERIITPTINHLDDFRSILNTLFKDNKCVEILYTLNTDKPFFGIKVDPVLTPTDSLAILASDDKMKLGNYKVEFDSKLFDLNLTADEFAAVLIHEISSLMDSYEIIDEARSIIDLYLLSSDDVIKLRDSVIYTQIITYGIKDTLYKLSSMIFKEAEGLISNMSICDANLTDSLISAQEKIISSSYGLGDTVREPKTIILQWVFAMFKDISINSSLMKSTLKDAKDFTASKLVISEIDRTIKAIDSILITPVVESLNDLFESKRLFALNELSIFKSLKQNGLKSIEDSLYEYAIRIKNCSTEEDAMYILRGINTRLSILEDYIYSTPDISEAERNRWENVANKYRDLREQLAKKKIFDKKQYGLFFDYNLLDQLDKDEY